MRGDHPAEIGVIWSSLIIKSSNGDNIFQTFHNIVMARRHDSHEVQRLQTLLYLRGNQMRVVFYRSVLLSPESIKEHHLWVERVIDIAKDTVNVFNQQSLFSCLLPCKRQQSLMIEWLVRWKWCCHWYKN